MKTTHYSVPGTVSSLFTDSDGVLVTRQLASNMTHESQAGGPPPSTSQLCLRLGSIEAKLSQGFKVEGSWRESSREEGSGGSRLDR